MPEPKDVSVDEILLRIVRAVVDRDGEVQVSATLGDAGATLTVQVNPADIGKLIGKQGRNISAIRTIISGIGMKRHRRVVVVVVETPTTRG